MHYAANSFYPGPGGGYGSFNTHQACIHLQFTPFSPVVQHTFFPRTALQMPCSNFQAGPAPSENILDTT